VDAGKRHIGLEEFKRVQDQIAEVETREIHSKTAESRLNAWFTALEKQAGGQTRRSKKLDEQKLTIDERESNVARREAEAAQEKEQARRETRDARVRTQQAEQAIAKTEKMNAELERVLTAVRADPRLKGVANSLTDTTEKVRKRVVAIKNDIPDFTPETGPELG
jgi:hypothetical protein